jgi:hypothetical protein
MGKDDFSYAQYADATARWQPVFGPAQPVN